MKSSALDFEEMARAGASNEQILRDVAEIDSEFLLEKEIILETLQHTDPLQADNWPIIMQAVLDIGIPQKVLTEKMYFTEVIVNELISGDIVPPEEQAVISHDELITAAHDYMRQLSDNIKNMQLGIAPN